MCTHTLSLTHSRLQCLKSNNLDKEDERYVDRQNHYGWTALMQAAINGHLNSVLLLLHHGARVDIQNCWGATALVVACQSGCFGVVHTLINHGANVNQGGTEEVKTLTPLMAAAQSGYLEIVRELVQGGACVDVRMASTGWTALMLAAFHNQVSTEFRVRQRCWPAGGWVGVCGLGRIKVTSHLSLSSLSLSLSLCRRR